MKIVIEGSIKPVNTSILIVLNNKIFLLDNPIKCHFGMREKVSLMTGKGLRGREGESILVMETRGINMQITSLQIHWKGLIENQNADCAINEKPHKYCFLKCSHLKFVYL